MAGLLSQIALKFGRTSRLDLHPRRQIKTPHEAALLFGGGASHARNSLRSNFPLADFHHPPKNLLPYRLIHSLIMKNTYRWLAVDIGPSALPVRLLCKFYFLHKA
jgi:hypothetical protein